MAGAIGGGPGGLGAHQQQPTEGAEEGANPCTCTLLGLPHFDSFPRKQAAELWDRHMDLIVFLVLEETGKHEPACKSLAPKVKGKM